jgi:hypothetical protein
VGADDLIDRNRRLLALAEVTCALTRLLVKEVAENRSLLQATLLRTVHLHYGRTGLLADAIYLRFSIAHEKSLTPPRAAHQRRPVSHRRAVVGTRPGRGRQ